VGQPVLVTAAVRDDGFSQHYVAPSDTPTRTERACAVVISDIATLSRFEIAWHDTVGPPVLVLDAAMEALAAG
jgi:hypothetical protein